MYHGQWYGKGDGWGALATLAALQHQLASGKGWGKSFDKGYKGGKKGKAAWNAGGKAANGVVTWGGHDRSSQWPCPSCLAPNGKPTLNREYRMCCHKCGESKPKGGKGLGKGAGQGFKAGAYRSNSPIGADGKKPLLGGPRVQEGNQVRGRTPNGGAKGCSDRRQQPPPEAQPRRYADVARTGKGEGPLGTAPPEGMQKGKGLPSTASKGKGKQEEADGFTTVDYRAGKKPKVQQQGPPMGEEGKGGPGRDGADTCDDDGDWTTGPAEFDLDDDRRWDEDGQADGDERNWYDHGYDDEGGAYDQEDYYEQDEAWGNEGAPGDHEMDLETARQKTRECRELQAHLRKTLGRNHVLTKRAQESLLEAEQREREARGPRSYWQEGRKKRQA